MVSYLPYVTEFSFTTSSEQPPEPPGQGEGAGVVQVALQGIEYGVFRYYPIYPSQFLEGFKWQT